MWREIYRNRAIYLFISPFYILFAIFGLFPIVFSLYLAFHKWDGIGEMEFVGLNQFRYLLEDANFWQSIWNTLQIWAFSTIPMLFMALVIAFMLHSALVKYKDFYRISFFLPNVTSIVAVAIVFGTLFGNRYGFLNFIITSLGLEPVQWLDSPFWIKIAISSMVVWRWTGYNAIIYLAGLQSIPSVLYEAARIDGASPMQTFFGITIPLIKPVILFTVITSTIGGMQIFTESQVFMGDSGGPGGGGMTIVLYLYQQAFTKNLFGYGSAVAWGLFVIIGLFSVLNWAIVQRSGSK
ncbi:sugar ABC transporter permease [Paenibacillus sp. H1-7]|uniref:carbohydrate ABC transporter permease n=1 Tax=Paenibacillus sp. H1-7 TaxID=2282849 RepID=UPI001EF81E6A|nr:sugar ABC transporter permease [Paenibacillus sp. H1-7]